MLLWVGCATTPQPVSRAQPKCGPEIVGAKELMAPGAVVLFGEMHGTNEIPYVVGEVACQAAVAGKPVTVAVELSLNEQARVDAFLASEGTAEDRERLLNGAFWNRPYQDGRSSLAMVALLDRVRVLKKAGLPIRAVAFDQPAVEHNVHEEAMAKNLLAARQGHEHEVFLVLCGNVHARTVQGTEWDPTLLPMGARLKTALPAAFRSLDAEYGAGHAWTCRMTLPIDCGVTAVAAPRRNRPMLVQPAGKPVPAPSPVHEGWVYYEGNEQPVIAVGGFQGYRPFVRVQSSPSPEGYDGIFYVGPITASPPATTASLEPE